MYCLGTISFTHLWANTETYGNELISLVFPYEFTNEILIINLRTDFNFTDSETM